MSIVLTDLTKRFEDNLVVHQVSLQVQDGEMFVLLGASGSGKTTILRLIAGLTLPDSGRIELNGRDVTFLPPQARGTGFVFQNYSVFRHMTVAQNVEFGLRIRKVAPAQRAQRAEELLDLVGLGGLGARYADQLSGGQQQRVALVRALAYEPAVLLIDEPFGALDVKIREQLRKTCKEIQRQLRVTAILVTHDQEEAFELADHIAVIDHGRVAEVGTPEELYHHPHTEFAATFIGGGNVLVGRKDAQQIRLGNVNVPMPQDAPGHDDGAPVRILFRPETVLLTNEPFPASGDVHVLGQGQVIERTFAGALQRLTLEVEGLRGVRPLMPPPAYGERTTHVEAVQPSGPATLLAPGQKLWIGLRDYHVLDPGGLKILICAEDSEVGKAASEFGLRLAHAAAGPATLLTVTDAAGSVPAARDKLNALKAQWSGQIPRMDTRVRQGPSAEQILLEAQEGHYELLVMGQHRTRAGTITPILGSTAQQVLAQSEAPLLLVQTARPGIQRILICTAGGEPGKSDVRFGGRLARRTGARVTVLHVRRRQTTGEQMMRARRHLDSAQRTLDALGVEAEIKIEEQRGLLLGILNEAETGDYDLVVIGAPAPRPRMQFMRTDFATPLARVTNRPLLVVPMIE
jgi:sulfate transport system ATP-binding protein